MKAHGLPGTHGRFFAKVHTICAMSVITHHVKSHALPTVAHAHAQGFLMVADKKASLFKECSAQGRQWHHGSSHVATRGKCISIKSVQVLTI